ncbi:MAG: diguanylate cyclase/phosphodiesterase with and sensor(s), partial [Acidimicrobiales bacterium]|nr:diguanylate cyclase/phosphodiesterase with and sensor(s) [Acidimicrobiales bacterium]
MTRTFQRRANLAVATAVLVFAVAMQLELPSVRGALIISNLMQCAAPALAALGCWFASRRAVTSRQGRAWLFFGASASSWCLGQVVWSYFVISGNAAPYPSVGDFAFLAAVPLALCGVWLLAARSPAATRLLAAVDGFIITGGLLAISWQFMLGQTWHNGGDRPLTFALSLAYPAGNLVVTSSILMVIMRTGRQAGPVPLMGLAAGLLLLVGADSMFVLATLRGTESQTSISDIGWVSGYLAIFLSSLTYPRRRSVSDASDHASLRRALLPFTILTVSLVLRLGLTLTGHRTDPFLVGVLVVTTGLVLVRQLLTMQENEGLTRSLEQKIGELISREEQLSHQAFHDPLTGLANRRLFTDRVDHALTLCRRTGDVTAVLFVDLDDFKTVNDSLGHAVGDQLLVAVGTRLSGCVRPGDTVARLGGDEFGILLEEVAEGDLPGLISGRMLEALDVPFPIAGRQVFTRASIGIALGEGSDSLDGEQLLADADVALYAAKAAGKATVRRFERMMRVSALERLELGQDLRRAVDLDQFFCEYQPIVDLITGRVVAVEALVRWDHPERGLIPPNAFVELAEETGMIGDVGRRVLEMATVQGAAWRRSGEVPSGFEMHVNLSGRQLEEVDLIEQVARTLASSGFPPTQLVLEITESVAVEVGARHLEQLVGLRELGVRIAIDDFGTGYSSLNYLRALPV